MKPLGIIPVYVRAIADCEMLSRTLTTIRDTAGDTLDILVIDDGSPEVDLITYCEGLAGAVGASFIAKPENTGFARTVNVGLRQALVDGRDAVLINSDVEFFTGNWLSLMLRQRTSDDSGLASVVGALLTYPNGLIQHAGILFCSPGDEEVLTAQDGYVAISELSETEHGLVSYARKENRIFRSIGNAGRYSPGIGRRDGGGYEFTRGCRDYVGRLLGVETARGVARLTPNHRLTVHWTARALGSWCVYLAKRGNDWRIGHAGMSHGGTAGTRGWAFGPRLRMDMEKADALWVLSLHETKQEAIYHERLTSWAWDVPTWQFVAHNAAAGITQANLDRLWRECPTDEAARSLLIEVGRDAESPLLVARRNTDRRRLPVGANRRYEVAAANLMPGWMAVPTDPGSGQTAEYLEFGVQEERFAGKVYSLEVRPHRHYISNGVIVHNSLLTRDFSHIYNYGPENLPEAQNARVCPVTGALQFIRHECLESVGLYDEGFKLGWEDVAYCVEVWLSGRECVYQPGVRAIHHESFFRGRGRGNEKIERWQSESWRHFCAKYGTTNFAEFVPNMLAEDGL